MPTLKQFRYLVAVADTLNFRRAAALVHISQPTLSDQLRLLEQRLGAQLVERSRTRVALTPIGHEVVVRARSLLRESQDIADLTKQSRVALAGRTRMGVLPTLGSYCLPLMLPEVHRRYPALKLHIREELSPDLLAHLEAGELDLVITAMPAAGTDIETATLFNEPLLLIAPREHPYAARRIIRRRDLAGQSLLTLERGHQLYKDVQALCSETGAVLLTEYEGTSLDTLRQMVGMGLGLAFLPALYVQMEARNDRQVVVCRLCDRSPKRTVVMAWRRHSPQRPHYLKIANLTRRIVSKNSPHIELLPDRSSESASDSGT